MLVVLVVLMTVLIVLLAVLVAALLALRLHPIGLTLAAFSIKRCKMTLRILADTLMDSTVRARSTTTMLTHRAMVSLALSHVWIPGVWTALV